VILDEDFDLCSWLKGLLNAVSASIRESIFEEVEGREEGREAYPWLEMGCRTQSRKSRWRWS
jgi:hypothetical protein